LISILQLTRKGGDVTRVEALTPLLVSSYLELNSQSLQKPVGGLSVCRFSTPKTCRAKVHAMFQSLYKGRGSLFRATSHKPICLSQTIVESIYRGGISFAEHNRRKASFLFKRCKWFSCLLLCVFAQLAEPFFLQFSVNASPLFPPWQFLRSTQPNPHQN